MIDHNKNWLLYDIDSNAYFEKSFSHIFHKSPWIHYDYFYKEIYACEFSSTSCIYEMWDCVINETDIVVDLGANVGFFTNYAAQKAKKVISVEGSPQLYSCLVKNTFENDNVEYINANIDKCKCCSSKTNTWGRNPSRTKIIIKDLFDLFDLSEINFLKVDIEGFEYEIFNNLSEDLISRIHKIAIEVHDPEKNYILLDVFKKKNFRSFDWFVDGSLTKTFYFY